MTKQNYHWHRRSNGDQGGAPRNCIREILTAAGVTEEQAGTAIWPGGSSCQSRLNRYKNRRITPTITTARDIVAGLRVVTGQPDLRLEDVFPDGVND